MREAVAASPSPLGEPSPAGPVGALELVELAVEMTGSAGGVLCRRQGARLQPIATSGEVAESAAAQLLAGVETGDLAAMDVGPSELVLGVPSPRPGAPDRGCLLLLVPRTAPDEASAQRLVALAHCVLSAVETSEGPGDRFCPVTGLLDVSSARARVERTLDAERSGRQYALLISDIADFNAINSAFGRAAGDRILRLAAQRLRRIVPRDALAFRVQGDQFGVFWEVHDPAEDIDHVVSALATGFMEPVMTGGQQVTLHMVFGTAVFPHRAVNGSELFDRSLLALRKAQEQRTGAEVFTNELEARLVRDVAVEQRLRAALLEGKLSVAYQPKVALSTGRIYGVEALCRWIDDDLGFVSPAEFIPAAERTGLIVELGRQVLDRALRDVLEMRAVRGGLSVSVNVAADQFARPDFVEEVMQAVAQAGATPDALELEVVESSIIRNMEQAVDMMTRLTGSGIRFSLDDFGTGFSSLAYLRHFPVQVLKLDRTFLAQVETSPRDAALVRSIIAMGHGLGFTVVAEGVESTEQAELLRSMGCDAGQGYLWAKPSPLAELLGLLED